MVADGWTYAAVTYDEDGNKYSFEASDDIWHFYTYDEIFNSAEVEDFDLKIYGAEPHEGNFDYDNVYTLFETFTSSLEWFYFYDSDGNVCDLQTEFNIDG
jgi:hypothetical protein